MLCLKTCWRNHLGAFSWSVDIHVLMSQTTSFEQLLFPLSKEIFLTNETDNNKKCVHIKTWLVRLPCLKVHITLWLLKTLFLHHGALMNPNYSYQTPFKSQWKKKHKEGLDEKILYLVLNMFAHYCCLRLAVSPLGQPWRPTLSTETPLHTDQNEKKSAFI